MSHLCVVTPPGQESRLTRAMKAYHLQKARHASDLPDWLFSERERGLRGREIAAQNVTERQEEYSTAVEEEVSHSRGLRDVYESAARVPWKGREEPSGQDYGSDSAAPSTATNRLRAIRDAKRSAMNASVSSASSSRVDPINSGYMDYKERGGYEQLPKGGGSTIATVGRRANIGLPPRPVRPRVR